MSQTNQPNFIPLQHSKTKVALHPNPIGIIQFVGSFIFGSFPNWSYKYLLQYLYDRGYSLISYRFPCNPTQFNHWGVAMELYKEQQHLRCEILKLLKKENQSDQVFNIYLNSKNYLWLGHSLGCKYIILLEILSNDSARRIEVLTKCLGKQAELLLQQFQPKLMENSFIKDQPSLLLAPEISNTVRFLTGWRISNPRTSPNQEQTECLIRSSTELFNLTGIISFNWDNIAEDDVAFILDQLENRIFSPPVSIEMEGGHFEPLGIYIDILGEKIDRSFNDLRSRLDPTKKS